MGLRPGAADPSFFAGPVAASVSPISGAWDIDIKQEPQDVLLESRGPRGLEPNFRHISWLTDTESNNQFIV